MHYYVFKVTENSPTEVHCKLLNKFEMQKEAKALARSSRAELPLNGTIQIDMIHAINQSQAEEYLEEKYPQNLTIDWNKAD